MSISACLALFPGNCGDIVRLTFPIHIKVKDVAQTTREVGLKVKRGLER